MIDFELKLEEYLEDKTNAEKNIIRSLIEIYETDIHHLISKSEDRNREIDNVLYGWFRRIIMMYRRGDKIKPNDIKFPHFYYH